MDRKITADTRIYTYTAEFSGYTLFDSVLGERTPAEYAELNSDHSEEENILALCEWLETTYFRYADDGMWLSAEDAEAWAREQEEAGNSPGVARTLEHFTPRSIHRDILAAAQQAR